MPLVTADPRWDDSLTVEPWDMFTGASSPGTIISLLHAHTRKDFPPSLRPAHRGGYIYCLAVPGDVYKVGLTISPADRTDQHRAAARSYGVAPLYVWVSPAHKEFRRTEEGLIAFLMTRAEHLGSESFRRPALFHDVCEWWDQQEIHPPGEFASEQRARLGI